MRPPDDISISNQRSPEHVRHARTLAEQGKTDQTSKRNRARLKLSSRSVICHGHTSSLPAAQTALTGTVEEPFISCNDHLLRYFTIPFLKQPFCFPLPKMKPGVKPKTFLDRLIPKIWYWTVKARGNWSDPDLDVEFLRLENGAKRDKADRVRAFEAIRARGVEPSSAGKKHWRRPFDLVMAVEAHPNFTGTSQAIHTPLWALLRSKSNNAMDATSIVEECLRRLGLTRIKGDDAVIIAAGCGKIFPLHLRHGLTDGPISDFECLLQRATETLKVDLDLIALFGSMFRESCLRYKSEQAEILKCYFSITLAQYSEQLSKQLPCNDKHAASRKQVFSDFEDLVWHRIINGEPDYEPSQLAEISDIESLYLNVILRPDDEILFCKSLWGKSHLILDSDEK